MAGNKLTVKQKKFIEIYLATGNATEAAIQAGYSDNHVTVVREPNIAYNDEGIEKLFNKFCEDHKGDNIEHTLVITMEGEVYHCIGQPVNISLLGTKLQGAKVIHNHPDDGNIYGDCSSLADFSAFFKYKIKRLEVISGLGHYSIEYNGLPLPEGQLFKLYNEAYYAVLDKVWKSGSTIEYMQRDIATWLGKNIKGLIFDEVKVKNEL